MSAASLGLSGNLCSPCPGDPSEHISLLFDELVRRDAGAQAEAELKAEERSSRRKRRSSR